MNFDKICVIMWKMYVVKIQELAKEKGVTLYRVAKDTGISYPTLHQMKERKVKMISLEVIGTLCDYFKCSVADLLVNEK